MPLAFFNPSSRALVELPPDDAKLNAGCLVEHPVNSFHDPHATASANNGRLLPRFAISDFYLFGCMKGRLEGVMAVHIDVT
jgi:hypothetical protein